MQRTTTPTSSAFPLKIFVGSLAFLLGIVGVTLIVYFLPISTVKFARPFLTLICGTCLIGFVSCLIRMITGVPGSGLTAARRIISVIRLNTSEDSSRRPLSPATRSTYHHSTDSGHVRARSLPPEDLGKERSSEISNHSIRMFSTI